MIDYFHRLPFKYERIQAMIENGSLEWHLADCPGAFDLRDLLWALGAMCAKQQMLQFSLAETRKAGDILAHQSVRTPYHDEWWRIRGHEACSVCNPAGPI